MNRQLRSLLVRFTFVAVLLARQAAWAEDLPPTQNLGLSFWVDLGYAADLPGVSPFLVVAGGQYASYTPTCIICGISLHYWGLFGQPLTNDSSPDNTSSADASARAAFMPLSHLALGPLLGARSSQTRDPDGSTRFTNRTWNLEVHGSLGGGQWALGGLAGTFVSGTTNVFSWGGSVYGMVGSDSSAYIRGSVFPSSIWLGNYLSFSPRLCLQVYGTDVTPRLEGSLDVRFGDTGFSAWVTGAYGYRLVGTTPPTGLATLDWISPEDFSVTAVLSFSLNL